MAKKKIAILCAVVALAAVAVVGTLAYFTDEDSTDNNFNVGDVTIELTETKWLAGGEEADDVYPGEALPKNPAVTNNGDNPCFIRIEVTGLDCLKEAGLSDEDITYETGYVTGALGTGWTKHTDGYFYYTSPVAADASTTDLFDQIRIPKDVINDPESATQTVSVKAEAVQAQGAKPSWSAVQSMTVAEIAAWFTTCGF